MEFCENLNIKECICPPNDAILPDGQEELYRVVKNNPPTSDCFVSHRCKNPDKHYPDECIAKAVSTFNSIDGLLNAFIKTPAGKKKERLIGKLVLNKTDGMLKQTFAEGHFSWWRSKSFDINTVTIQKIEA